MEMIGESGLVRRNGNDIEFLHNEQWVKVGFIKLWQFIPSFPDGISRMEAIEMQAKAQLAFSSKRVKSIAGGIKKFL